MNITYKKVSEFFLLFSIALLFIKKSVSGINISDICLLISGIILFSGFLKKEIEFNLVKKEFNYFAAIVACFFVGSIMAIVLGYQINLTSVIWEYVRYLSSFLFAVILIVHIKTNKFFLNQVGSVLMVSLVLIPLSYLVKLPSVATILYDSSVYRFAGLSNDPNYFTYFFLLPTVIILHILTEKLAKKKYVASAVVLVVLSCCIGLFVWSGSRGGMLGLIASFLVYGIIYFYNNYLDKKNRNTLLFLFMLTISFVSCFTFLPSEAKVDTFKRFPILRQIMKNGNFIEGKYSFSETLVGGQSRAEVWRQAIYKIKENPLGYGPSYNTTINLAENRINTGSDSFNIVLQTLLTGGIQLLVLFCISVFVIVKRIEFSLLRNRDFRVVISCLLGVLVMSLFLDSLQAKVLWLLVSVLYWLLFQKVCSLENDSR